MKRRSILLLAAMAAAMVLASGVALAASEDPPTFLSEWGDYGSGDGQFDFPHGVATDSSGNIYVADYNDRVQKFDQNGTFLTKWGSSGSGNGQFNAPQGVAIDSSGNIYVADYNNRRVQKFDQNGTFLTKWGSFGSADGQFNGPEGVATDSSDNVYVTDSGNNRVQKFDQNGTFLTKWDISGGTAGIATDSSDNVYVTTYGANKVRKFNSGGTFLSEWGSSGSGDGQFSGPIGIATDSSNNAYVVDSGNERVQKFDQSGTFLTKWGSYGSGEGQFDVPYYVATDTSGNVYVTERYNNRVQKFGTESQPPEPGSVVVTKTTTNASIPVGGSTGYRIEVQNDNSFDAGISSITDDLPAGFEYKSGSTRIACTGGDAQTIDPSVSGQTLIWEPTEPWNEGANESGGCVLSFQATAVTATPGSYFNNATVDAGSIPVTPTGDTAQVTVTKGTSKINLSPDPSTITYGQLTTIRGKLTDSDGAPLGGRRVILWEVPSDTMSTSPWTHLPGQPKDASGNVIGVLTGSDGTFSRQTVDPPQENMVYRGTFDGDTSYYACCGVLAPGSVLSVKPKVTLSFSDKAPRPNQRGFTISGKVTPAHAGEVRITIWRNGKGVQSSNLTLNNSQYTWVYPKAKLLKGKYEVQIETPSHADHEGASVRKTFTVR